MRHVLGDGFKDFFGAEFWRTDLTLPNHRTKDGAAHGCKKPVFWVALLEQMRPVFVFVDQVLDNPAVVTQPDQNHLARTNRFAVWHDINDVTITVVGFHARAGCACSANVGSEQMPDDFNAMQIDLLHGAE
jgi:hypothetical protein